MIESAHSSAARLRDVAFTPREGRQRPGSVRIAVIGEANSGKTTLVNTLLGAPILPTSVAAHTTLPTLIGYSGKSSLVAEVPGGKRIPLAWEHLHHPPRRDVRRVHVGVPLNLRGVCVLDTPALSLDNEAGNRRTLHACRGADLLIWCTPAIQAWKHSEQSLWLMLSMKLRGRGILAATFADQIQSDGDAHRLMARLQADAGCHFRQIVLIAGMSATGGTVRTPSPARAARL